MIDELQAKMLHLQEQLVAHAERHIDAEEESVKLVGLVRELVDLVNKLRATMAAAPVSPVADAALREANAIAVVIGQYQSRMMNTEKYHAELATHGRTLRQLLNAAGYPAPGSTPEG